MQITGILITLLGVLVTVFAVDTSSSLSVIGYVIGVNRTSSFIGIATVVSIITGALILKESFSTVQIIGAAIIVIGVYTANAKGIV